MTRTRALTAAATLAAIAGGLTILTVVSGYWLFSKDLPRIITVADYRPAGVTRVIAFDGAREVVVAEFFKERRYLVPLEKVPDHVVKAFLAAEDEQFFEHQGVSLGAILRATVANFRAGHVVQGGSTITMQLARSLFLTQERSFIRKIKEAVLAWRIERNLSKEQVLYLYLNQIFLGHGAYGIQAAAQTYFRKDVSQLELAEASILAGMPKAPSRYGPLTNPSRAKSRQLYVLRRMVDSGYIPEEAMTKAASQPVKVYHLRDPNQEFAPHLVEHVRRHIVKEYGEKAVYEDGLTAYVPANPRHLKVARRALEEGLREVDKTHGYRGPVSSIDLNDPEALPAFLAESREKVIAKRLDYRILLPEGRLGIDEAMRDAGLELSEDLWLPAELYDGVVTSVDDKAMTAWVALWPGKVRLPFSEMSWAGTVVSAGEGSVIKPPAKPSDVLRAGDVILLSTKVIDDKNAKGGREIVAALEQKPEVQGAIVSIETGTGYVLAMEGGYDFSDSEFNRAVQAKRQPGSAFKPVIYCAGLENGYTPASILVDSPVVYEDEETGKWKPSNFSEKFHGDTMYRMALAKSRNIPTIKLVQAIEVPNIIEYARRLGWSGEFNEDLSISLGSATTSLMELTQVYSVFPRHGRRVEPLYLKSVVDRDGRVLEESVPQAIPEEILSKATPLLTEGELAAKLAEEGYRPGAPGPARASASGSEAEPGDGAGVTEGAVAAPGQAGPTGSLFGHYPLEDDPAQVIDPKVAFVMTHLLTEVVKFGTGKRVQGLGRPTGAKTGTTNDYKDAWFMGFTPDVVTGVWVGYDDQRSLGPGGTGAKLALPIWLEFMKNVALQYPEHRFMMPAGVKLSFIDEKTGKLTDPAAPGAVLEAFVEGTEPTEALSSGGEDEGAEGDFLKEDL